MEEYSLSNKLTCLQFSLIKKIFTIIYKYSENIFKYLLKKYIY